MTRIRNFSEHDWEKILLYKKETSRASFPGCTLNEEIFRKAVQKRIDADPETVKVVEIDGEVCGYIWFRIVNSDVGVFGRIEQLFVDKRHRGKGLGKLLMSEAEKYVRKHGIRRMKLTVTCANDAATELYKKIGYETKRFVMEKDL